MSKPCLLGPLELASPGKGSRSPAGTGVFVLFLFFFKMSKPHTVQVIKPHTIQVGKVVNPFLMLEPAGLCIGPWVSLL